MSDNPTCPQFPARPPHGGEPFIVPPAPRRRPGLPVLSVNGHAPDGHGDLALTYIDGAEYAAGYGDPPGPALLFRQGDEVVAVVDATPLLKDGMVSSVAVSGGNLVVTFNTDAGKEPVEIPLTDIFDPDDFALIGDIAPDWTATAAVGTVFATNQLCSYGGRIYRCKLGYTFNGENPPSSDATHWEPTTVEDVLAAKQDAIGDLAAIRSGAAAGATAYQKPAGGITASDLAAAVQTSLGKADTALQAQDITGKADMVANATHGHFAALTSTGNLVDSGKAAADFLPKTGGTVNGDLEVVYGNTGFTVKDASGNYLRLQHGVVAGDFWYVDYYVANAGNGSLRLPYDNIIPADIQSLAGYFNESTVYTYNSLCVGTDGRLYRCVNPNGHAGAWADADFAVATVEDVLAALRTGKADASTTYTKDDVDAIVQALKTGSREIVGTLPASGEPMVIYMVPKSAASQANNSYDEYIWTAAGAWEKIGDTEIDLSGYYTKADTDALLYAQAQDIAGKADKVAGAVDGHLAGLDGGGNLTDSGFAPGEFAAASSLAAVATSGSYDDLAGKPTALSDFTDDVGYVTDVSDKLDSVAASPAYSASQDYAYGDTVTFDGRRYMCISPVSVSGGDTAADPPDDVVHWTERTVDDSLGDKADKVANAVPGNLAALDAYGNPVDSLNTVQGTFSCGELVVGYSPSQRFVDILGQGAVTDHCTVIVYNSDSLGHYHYIALPNSDGADKVSVFALEREIAPAFDVAATYAEGALVYYNDVLYRCTTAVTSAGAWTGPANWTAASVEDVLAALRTGKADASALAPAFSSDSAVQYAVGSHCTYNGRLYKCTTATTGGTWAAGNWAEDTMTDPDAVLDITAQNRLRVVAKDGTLLWAQGYDLASASSATLACDAVNNFTFADGATSQAFALPAAPTGKVGDFVLDVDNSANTGAATMTLTGLDTTFSVVVPKGKSLNDMLAIAAGELAQFYITLSTFRVNNLPTWHIAKQVVENGGATA